MFLQSGPDREFVAFNADRIVSVVSRTMPTSGELRVLVYFLGANQWELAGKEAAQFLSWWENKAEVYRL